MTATANTDMLIGAVYVISGCWWAMRAGWRLSDPKRDIEAWWVL